jgi:hypothetical protein
VTIPPPGAPPVAFRLKRPYANEDEFVAGDGHGVFKSGMVLIGAGPRPSGLIVRFEVALRDGSALFRGEGRVVEHRMVATSDRPAGLEVKFTRLDPRGKSIVDRALRARAPVATTPGPPPAIPDLTPLPGAPNAPPPEPPPPPRPSDEAPLEPQSMRDMSSLVASGELAPAVAARDDAPAIADEAPARMPPVATEDEAPTRMPPVVAEDEALTRVPPIVAEDEAPTRVPPLVDDDEQTTIPPAVAEDEAPTRMPPVVAEDEAPTRMPPVVAEDDAPTRMPPVATAHDDVTTIPPVVSSDERTEAVPPVMMVDEERTHGPPPVDAAPARVVPSENSAASPPALARLRSRAPSSVASSLDREMQLAKLRARRR